MVRDGDEAVRRLGLPGGEMAEEVASEVDRDRVVVRGGRRDGHADESVNGRRREVVHERRQAAGSICRVYARGVDADSRAPRLGQLKALPDNRVQGLSGSLSINASQRIERQLPWAEFSGGQVKRLPDTAN